MALPPKKTNLKTKDKKNEEPNNLLAALDTYMCRQALQRPLALFLQQADVGNIMPHPRELLCTGQFKS